MLEGVYGIVEVELYETVEAARDAEPYPGDSVHRAIVQMRFDARRRLRGSAMESRVMRVMVAHSQAAYREVIAIALRDFRPHLEVIVAEPEELDREFANTLPQLVVCSRVTDLVERNTLAWIELYPDSNATESVVSLAGKKVIYPNMDFETLLSVLDEAAHLHETA